MLRRAKRFLEQLLCLCGIAAMGYAFVSAYRFSPKGIFVYLAVCLTVVVFVIFVGLRINKQPKSAL